MIASYEAEADRFEAAFATADRKTRAAAVDGFIDTDATKISWSRALKADLGKGKRFRFADAAVSLSQYRPFARQWLYYSRSFNEMVYQMPRIFPMEENGTENRVIQVSGVGARAGFAALMSKNAPNFDTIEKGQCFPRWLYEVAPKSVDGQLALDDGASTGGLTRRDAITDAGLAHFQAAYPGETITKDDLFHYVYGLLHSEDYRSRFADNLSKELPRIPAVKKAADFWGFVEAGRALGDLHCDYDAVAPFPVTIAQGALALAHIPDPVKYNRVEKMRFGGKRPNVDKTTILYNSNITITGVPLEAYDYVVNGKPVIEWVMERQGVKVDKASGIIWDANEFANETMGDPAYPLKLLQRVMTVSLETVKIVRSLPKLEIGDQPK